MKHLRKALIYLLLAVNIIFIVLLLYSAYSPWIINPTVHPILSCIGLIFPIFLFINFGFLIFWLFTYPRLALIPVFGFLLCMGQIRTYVPVNFRTDKIPVHSVKVLSYNVMGFNKLKKHTKEEYNPIIEYILKKNPDIICLQEFQFSTDKSLLTETDINRAFSNYPYHVKTNLSANGNGNWLACYSKFPILSSRRIPYESIYNGSAMYELLVGRDTVTLVNNHLESNKLTKEDKDVYVDMIKDPEARKVKKGVKHLVRKFAEASAIRAVQADAVGKEIAASKHQSIIVCGDFNDTPISYAHRVIAQNLNDAFTISGRGIGISYNQHRFYFRIDNILISKNLKAYNCTVDKSIKESDHYPIWCYIALKK
ncbi:endonuclease/exonuclease/phosphatase family protein [uncultured Bacteroides sp.]|uniref:endonuclease/exonuclease/phosphatase family protein n=1 Tax=uncultured Bacteroides sp. TaxID=162156 RepID=UPI002AAADFA3|nr:endonuclease/exonuclease/phosphatase family protein [uncultured Bacteroides sp.]